MAAVFKRPSLVGIEILWRWSFGVVLLVSVWWKFGAAFLAYWIALRRDIYLFTTVALHGGFIFSFDTRAFAIACIVMLSLCLAWAVLSGLVRDLVLRRMEVALHSRRGTLAMLAIARVLSFVFVIAFWMLCFLPLARWAVLEPLAHHDDPAYVFGFAIVVCLTLALFVLWSLTSWIFRIAPILAMAHKLSAWQSLRAAVYLGPLRSKLIEINFVMGIVKIALLVLAMVFSACPLPFSSVETQTFLTWWWIGVGVLYLLASDYFHVVRAAAYITLWKAYDPARLTSATAS